ncbi:hypothetical protein BS78_09G095200 [Paspalum vaginatum]|nr:hypothetical protein BS78_09G095200 [Paspalum vaginatum]
MTVDLRAMGGRIWKIVNDGYVILKEDALSPTNEDNILVDDQAKNVLYDALDVSEFNRIKNLKTAHEIWTRLMEIHEGTTMVKSAKLYVYKGKFIQFVMNKEESVSKMCNRLNEIVNELKGLSFDVPDEVFSHKFLRSLPCRYHTIVTLLVRCHLKTNSPTEVLGEVTHDIFKRSQEEAHGGVVDEKKKCIAFKAQASKKMLKDDNEDESCGGTANLIQDKHACHLWLAVFNKFLKKKKSFSRKNRSSTKNPFGEIKCYKCGEPGHIAIYCPSNKKNDSDDDEKKKKKKPYNKKKKNGLADLVEWDSDASLDSDDDGKKENDCDEDEDKDEEEYTYDDLVRMLKEADDYMHKEKLKYKSLKKKNKDLEESLCELKSSHENLKEAHDKLEEANTQLVHEVTKAKEEVVKSHVMESSPDAPSSSTSLFSTSNEASASNGSSISVSTSDDFSCDTTLIVENENIEEQS